MRHWIAQRISAIITEKNIAARKLSFAIGKSEGYMSQLLNGKINFSVDVLEKICEELHVTPEEFFAYPQTDNKNVYLLLRETEGLTDEDILYLCECAKYLKAKNRQIRKRK